MIKRFKNPLRGAARVEVRVLSPFSPTLSLFLAVRLASPLASLSLSPFTAFTLDRSLPLPLGESCSSDLALAATFLLSRLRSLPLRSLADPLALVVISSTHLRSCVTSLVVSYTPPGFIRVCDTFFAGLI